MLKYIELKEPGHRGPAWIARVRRSRSGRCLYFNGRALKRVAGGGVLGNHVDLESDDEYWISNVKRDGRDRHRHGSGVVSIEAGVVDEYLALVGASVLDTRRLVVIEDLPATDPAAFTDLENRRLGE